MWPASDVATEVGPYLQNVVDSIGGLDLDEAPFAGAPTAALAFAIVDRKGSVRTSDDNFAALGIDIHASRTIVRLLGLAGRGEPALGLVESRSGAMVAVCVASSARAATWPMSDELRSTLEVTPQLVAMMAYAPARASELALRAVAVFGLSELEARVAVALLEAPTLEIAASLVGVGRETARDALSGAMRKMGVRRTPLLIRRLSDLICGDTFPANGDPLTDALGLTAGEAKVTRLTAEGGTTASVAEALGVKPETVKSHLRSAFSKAGVTRAKDLARLDVELRALGALARAQEVTPQSEAIEGRLRMIARPDGRRVAFMDYGPASGRLVFVLHALASGRTLPPNLARSLKAAGLRPVVPQRPGFGLTDAPSGDYLAAAADDMAAILNALKRDTADVFAKDIATASVLAFAERYPDRLDHTVLLNPERQTTPGHERAAGLARRYAIPASARLLQRHPELARAFFELLRRQTRTDRLTALLLGSFKAGAPSDIEGLADVERLAWMVRDIQAMVARSITGIVQERMVYARGWRAPRNAGGRRWTIARSTELGQFEAEDWWNALPDSRFEALAAGGLLTPMTHPDAVVRLLTATRDSCAGPRPPARAG